MQLLPQILGNGLGAGLDMELFIYPPQIGADGVYADAQLIGNRLVGKPFRETVQNHFLARGEVNLLVAGLPGLLK